MRFQTGGGVHRSGRCNLRVAGVGGQIARRDAGHRTCIRGFVTEEFERILRHEHGDPLCRLFLEWLESNSRSRRVLNSCDESADILFDEDGVRLTKCFCGIIAELNGHAIANA